MSQSKLTKLSFLILGLASLGITTDSVAQNRFSQPARGGRLSIQHTKAPNVVVDGKLSHGPLHHFQGDEKLWNGERVRNQWAHLTPEQKQERLRKRKAEWDSLSLAQRQERESRRKEWEHLTPAQRQQRASKKREDGHRTQEQRQSRQKQTGEDKQRKNLVGRQQRQSRRRDWDRFTPAEGQERENRGRDGREWNQFPPSGRLSNQGRKDHPALGEWQQARGRSNQFNRQTTQQWLNRWGGHGTSGQKDPRAYVKAKAWPGKERSEVTEHEHKDLPKVDDTAQKGTLGQGTLGQGTLGQGTLGQGTLGQGTLGQGTLGQAGTLSP